MLNMFFLANYPTHAQMWWIVQSNNEVENPRNSECMVVGRDGNVYYVWHSFFATRENMADNHAGTVSMCVEMGSTVETVVLS